jgi:hypothetical protein
MAQDKDVVMAYSRYSLCVCLEGQEDQVTPELSFFMFTVQHWLISISILHCTHPYNLRLNLNGINIYVWFTEYICLLPKLQFEIVVRLKQISCHKLKDRNGEVPMHAMRTCCGELLHSFLTLVLDWGEWSDLYPGSFSPGKVTLVGIEVEAVWAPDLVQTPWRREKSFGPDGNWVVEIWCECNYINSVV